MRTSSVNSGFIKGTMAGFAIAFMLMLLVSQISSFPKVESFGAEETISRLDEISSVRDTMPHNFINRINTIRGRVVSRVRGDEQILKSESTPSDPQIEKSSFITQAVETVSPIISQPNEAVLGITSAEVVAHIDNGPDISRDQCQERFGTRSFLSLDRKRLPPMLYTFPGSGNTWGRLLIEHATGIYTGGVYNDKTLLDVLPGEFTCDWRVSVVKVHPHTHDFQSLYSGSFNSDANKCKRGGVKRFERAVLLIRNPFDSIWSEYQRRVTQSHVDGITKANFDWSRWQANAAALSWRYMEMWSQHYAGIERTYKREDILYLRYEDLRDKTRRVDVMGAVVKFLHMDVPRERLQCAFKLAESSSAHRVVDVHLEMTKEIAYTPQLACRMWSLFGKYIVKHGYTTWKHFNCTGYPAIPQVNVGPRGEYNWQWVKEGNNLMDFGGYDANRPAQPNLNNNQYNITWRGTSGPAAAALSRAKNKQMQMLQREMDLEKGPGGGGGSGGSGAGGTGGPAWFSRRTKKQLLKQAGGGMSSSSPQQTSGRGMTLSQALSVPGVSNADSKKPAWSD